MRYFIGLMSGTSVDSIDVALVSFLDEQPTLHAFSSHPIPQSLQTALLGCNQTPTLSLATFCELQAATGRLFAEAVNQFLDKQAIQPEQITAIGSHGQTIFHAPEIGMSLQIGHPAMIAKQTGIQTVADFRIDDMALGGQGAPFAPAFHQYLFAENDQPVVAVNIGGIANISFIPAGKTQAPLLGFDTGPGNGLMDEICRHYFDQPYDTNGAIAAQGRIHAELLNAMLQEAYFAKPAPKSTGRDYFNQTWLNKHLCKFRDIAPQDLMATLCELTAVTLAKAIQAHAQPTNVWICGGGAFNDYLLARLQANLNGYPVQSSAEKGIDPNAIEGMLFAWLANQRLENRPVNLKDVTGATRNAVLGGVWAP